MWPFCAPTLLLLDRITLKWAVHMHKNARTITEANMVLNSERNEGLNHHEWQI
jgi:hypothetical protein